MMSPGTAISAAREIVLQGLSRQLPVSSPVVDTFMIAPDAICRPESNKNSKIEAMLKHPFRKN